MIRTKLHPDRQFCFTLEFAELHFGSHPWSVFLSSQPFCAALHPVAGDRPEKEKLNGEQNQVTCVDGLRSSRSALHCPWHAISHHRLGSSVRSFRMSSPPGAEDSSAPCSVVYLIQDVGSRFGLAPGHLSMWPEIVKHVSFSKNALPGHTPVLLDHGASEQISSNLTVLGILGI